jgi:ACS family hexuronate transporter-like MFS transporter
MKGKLRWVIVSLVALATIINYIDRGALAVLWPEISADLGMTKTDYAIIINVFTFAYAFGQTLFGKIFDWIGTRLGFVLAIGVWSLATILHAVATSLLTFSIFRGPGPAQPRPMPNGFRSKNVPLRRVSSTPARPSAA